jgi:Ras-related protein Rab-8A
VPTARGQALADEYGIKFFETVRCLSELSNFFSSKVVCLSVCYVFQSAKTNLNVEQVFFSIARDIKQRLAETDSKPEVQIITHSCT